MNKLAFLLAGAAALALSACDDADDTDDTAVVETETALPAPVVTESTVVGEGLRSPSATDPASHRERPSARRAGGFSRRSGLRRGSCGVDRERSMPICAVPGLARRRPALMAPAPGFC